MTYRERMRARREELGLTLEQVANAIGTSKQTIQRYESGEITKISTNTMELIAEVLMIDPAELMGWKRSDTSDERTLAAHREGGYDEELPEEAKAELETILEYLKAKYKKKD